MTNMDDKSVGVRKRTASDMDQPSQADLRAKRAGFLASLDRGVSPPPPLQAESSLKNRQPWSSSKSVSAGSTTALRKIESRKTWERPPSATSSSHSTSPATSKPMIVPSPFRLSKIQDLPARDNVDSVSLHDILGDPLIHEAWIFNFCFDVDWVMQHFDPDTRDMVKVKIVHGSWRREDMNKILIDEACSRWPNVEAIQAYLPDAFGTHHSKMFVLVRHDDSAQVIIHTANMLSKDWTNMTQAIWRSPLLPLRADRSNMVPAALGSGARFQHDLLRYLGSYGSKLKPLVQQLQNYDFGQVRAALIASVPSKFKNSAATDEVWGHEALRRAIEDLPRPRSTNPHFVFQVSSIASLPPEWLSGTLYKATGASATSTSIIFPTAADVGRSLDGYVSGGSIHTKAQSTTHLKQITRLQRQLCRWSESNSLTTQAARHLAAPHVKTYIRYACEPSESVGIPEVDWALLTSANLSTQAWGSLAKVPKGSEHAHEAIVHIQSFEIGVLIWPALFAVNDSQVKVVPVFRTDQPDPDPGYATVVGLRMPYDLPLTRYDANELPWSPQSVYKTPDRYGRTWPA